MAWSRNACGARRFPTICLVAALSVTTCLPAAFSFGAPPTRKAAANARSYEWFLGALPGIPRQVARPVTTAGGKPGLGQSSITASGVVSAAPR